MTITKGNGDCHKYWAGSDNNEHRVALIVTNIGHFFSQILGETLLIITSIGRNQMSPDSTCLTGKGRFLCESESFYRIKGTITVQPLRAVPLLFARRATNNPGAKN